MKTAKNMGNAALAAVERADLAVTRAIAPQRHDPAVRKAGKLSEIGDQPPLIALSATVLVAGLALHHGLTARTGLRMLATHALATAIKDVIKRSVDRTRPDHALVEGYRMESGDSHEHELTSFPSGHTAGAVAVAEAVAREVPLLGAPARLLAASVAIIQVPRAKHYVSDVIVGAAIGWAAERLVNAVVESVFLTRHSREGGYPEPRTPRSVLRSGSPLSRG
ncbi:phosphatase PAP2 family protein [Sphingomonas qomolangmaensis]|uniref:Phosphatase PAP2 family protein n=1 Tax=Sphingomonas qomolangmaensis TaxID=2918765 RepID=A0ABY5L677_9SPHN|nr:phosphatase PAP2 family protein [Sphingomonas qomolangmaensis]UUL81407.1 phosphatase PAP2 family protein [Sphingomonas qomolangmaensis]